MLDFTELENLLRGPLICGLCAIYALDHPYENYSPESNLENLYSFFISSNIER